MEDPNFPREGRPWTIKENRFLLEGLQRGEIVEQLNVRIKRSTSSIVEHVIELARDMYKLGLSLDEIHMRTAIDPETIQKIIASQQSPKLQKEIAEQAVVCTPEPILERPAPVQAPEAPKPDSRKGSRWTAQEEAELLNLVKQGKSRADIASTLGRTPKAVLYRLVEYALRKVQSGDDVATVSEVVGLSTEYLNEAFRKREANVVSNLVSPPQHVTTPPSASNIEEKLDQMISICTEIRDLLKQQ